MIINLKNSQFKPLWMGITGRQDSWKTKFGGWGGVGRGGLAWCLVPADSPGPDLTVGG